MSIIKNLIREDLIEKFTFLNISLFFGRMERDYDREYERQPKGVSLRSTGGAVPIKNSKGEISMQKVKVQRYIAGKRPKYAGEESEEEEVSEPSDSNDEETTVSTKQYQPDNEAVKANTGFN